MDLRDTLLGAVFFLLVSQSPAWAEPPKDEAGKAVVFEFETTDPQACPRLKAVLKEKKIEFESQEAEARVLDPVCGATTGPVARQTIVLIHKPTAEQTPAKGEAKSINLLKLSLDATAGLTRGNDNFSQVGGSFTLNKRWNAQHVLELKSKGDYRSDKELEAVFNASADYLFVMSRHWALFSVVSFMHDGTKQIDYGTSEIAGVLYNVFPITDKPTDPSLSFSVGPGHRYEAYRDNTDIHASIVSYRMKFDKDVARNMRLAIAVWYQHLLHGRDKDGLVSVYDMTDYRFLFDMKLKVFFGKPGKGWSLLVGVENEYFSKPPVDRTEKNDLRTKLGVGYTW